MSIHRTIPEGKVCASRCRGLSGGRLLQVGEMLDHDLLTEIRRENLRSLATELGGPTELANKANKSEGQISHLIGKNAFKPVGEKLAREFESLCGKPLGWMDKVHGVNEKLLKEVMKQVDTILKEKKKKLDDDKRGELVSLCYTLVAQHSADKGIVRKLILMSISA